jgi:hypothetical protein
MHLRLRRDERVQLRAEEIAFGVKLCNSTQRSQFAGILRNPSQTPTKVAACEIAFGAKLCNSTP